MAQRSVPTPVPTVWSEVQRLAAEWMRTRRFTTTGDGRPVEKRRP